jgi:cysteine desulfurase/selenocysteine lyase
VVLLSDREFPANVYPWLAQRRGGVVVERAPVTARGYPDEDYLVERLADPRVRVLAVSLVQFSNGFRADLERLGNACRAHGVRLVVDAIQGLGVVPLDVSAVPVDLLACGGQKWLLGPWGSGLCFVRRELIRELEPPVVGWMAYEGMDDFTNLLGYNDRLVGDARRFEVASLATQDHLGLATSIGLLLELGVEGIAAYLRSLGEPVLAWARRHGVPIVSPTDDLHRSQIVCVAPPDAREAHRRLRQAGIVCALREGAIRLAPHCYNTMDEMEKVVEVLEQVMRQ